MSRSRFLSPRYIIGAVAALVLFVVFNMTRPPLETETQAKFIKWYEGASQYLTHPEITPVSPRKISAAIKITRGATSPSVPTTEWIVPTGGLEDSEQRSRLARVLELVKESQIYGNSSYLSATPPAEPYLSISVTEGEDSFSAFTPLVDLEKNIQLKNLIKILEIFSASPAPTVPPLNPTQL